MTYNVFFMNQNGTVPYCILEDDTTTIGERFVRGGLTVSVGNDSTSSTTTTIDTDTYVRPVFVFVVKAVVNFEGNNSIFDSYRFCIENFYKVSLCTVGNYSMSSSDSCSFIF